MTSGPEHYLESERLLEAAKEDWRNADSGAERMLAESRVLIALNAAGVHARLALVAATIDGYHSDPEPPDWSEVVS